MSPTHAFRTGIAIACASLVLTVCASTLAAADPNGDLRERMASACSDGAVGDVRLLLSEGAQASGMDSKGYSFINNASRNVHDGARIIPLLMAHGANPNLVDASGDTALGNAICEDIPSNVQVLLKNGADVNAPNNNGDTPIMVRPGTDTKNHVTICKLLLAHHPNLNVYDKLGWKPIHHWVDCLEGLKLLIANGAHWDAKTKDGETPIMLALDSGIIESVAYLLDKGGDIHALNAQGIPGWMYAVDDTDMLTFLISRGLDINERAPDGSTALDIAVSQYKPDTLNIVDYLLKHGADPNLKAKDGRTPYSIAVGRSDDHRDKIIDLLVAAGEKDAHVIPLPPDVPMATDSDEAAILKALLDQHKIVGDTVVVVNQYAISGPRLDDIAKEISQISDIPAELSSALPNRPAGAPNLYPSLDGIHGYVFAKLRHLLFDTLADDNAFRVQYPHVVGVLRLTAPVFDRSHQNALVCTDYAWVGTGGRGKPVIAAASRKVASLNSRFQAAA